MVASEPTTTPAEFLADIVPTTPDGYPDTSSYIVRAHLDLGLLVPLQPTPLTLVFESNITTALTEGQVYAVYLHIEQPGIGSLAVYGTYLPSPPEGGTVTFEQWQPPLMFDGGPTGPGDGGGG